MLVLFILFSWYLLLILNYIKISLLIECDNGTFGRGCGHKCGECFNSTQCNNIDGICEFGCAPGFLGVTCKDGKNAVKL